MPPDDDITGGSPAGEGADDAAAAAEAAVDAGLAQTPESVRNTPEFRAVERQLRTTARQLGSARAAETRAREAAEQARQAAEAERQAAMESQLATILGEDGIADFQGLAELSATDPVAAARRFAELTARAQSAGQPAPTTAPASAPEGATVPAQTPPPPPGGVDGNAPLMTSQGEDIEALTASLDKQYADVVERNQDPLTRGRVTMRDRASALIAFLGSSYVKAMRPPTRPGQ